MGGRILSGSGAKIAAKSNGITFAKGKHANRFIESSDFNVTIHH